MTSLFLLYIDRKTSIYRIANKNSIINTLYTHKLDGLLGYIRALQGVGGNRHHNIGT